MRVQDILDSVPADKATAFHALHKTILEHLPEGFETAVSYGMVGYVVPHRIYPAGYHCKPQEPLPFVSIAAQKHSINLYHMGIYADAELLRWFLSEYPKHSTQKLDMGKSCIRFKKEIPYALIGALIEKMTVEQWIELYENRLHKD
jgi:hypothetical protein